MKNIRGFQGSCPELGQRVYIDPAAIVIGKVDLADDVSVWPGVAMRGDVERITIGEQTNVQDNSTLHVTHDGPYTPNGFPLTIGKQVTVGHGVVLHACTVGDRVLVGMGSIVLDGAVIADDCMIGAGSIVSPGTQIKGKQLWLGRPARPVRDLSDQELDMLRYSATHYVKLKDQYLDEQRQQTDVD